MTELTSSIGRFNAKTGSVPVTFTAGDIVHRRDVRAVLTAAGKCDRKKTSERVAEVARGVAAKIDLGVIVAPPVEEEGATE